MSNACTVIETMRAGRRLVGVALFAISVGASCTRPNPALCCTSADDCNSVGVNADEKPCDIGLACVSHTCVGAPDGGTSACLSDEDCRVPMPYCSMDHVC